MRISINAWTALLLGLLGASCGSDATSGLQGTGGGRTDAGGTATQRGQSSAAGGAARSGGAANSGGLGSASGGASAGGAATGGNGSGGLASRGGAPTSGGTGPATGGTPTGGGATLGGTSSGGTAQGGSATGGLLNTGGTTTGGNAAGGSAGGFLSAGGTNAGGLATGGSSGGSAPAGGTSGVGGSAAGGNPTGGSSGGTATGGRTGGTSSVGGTPSGGTATGGSTTGGTATGGTATGGASALPKFILGADISSVDEAMDRGTRYADTDGTTKSIFDILKNHGFNFIRLRAFVKPGATYGYAYGTGGSCIKSETYCDTAHTVAFAKQVKTAGMGFLLDLHYSDNWADPGNQIVPEDWRNAGSIAQLASYVKTYTQQTVSALVEAGARPDIVQIGNETTPGMLVHVPNSNTDCWGNNVSTASINGSTSNWTNLGQLLKAGVEGVKAVDTSIKIMVHIENTKSASGVVSWVRNARNQGVALDIVGLSCYVAYQGEPSVWQNTFTTLASTFSDLFFVIAEYNPQRTAANQVMHDLPNGRGLGTFFWEPTQSGEWGSSLFTSSGGTVRANAADFAEFDTIRQNFGL